MYSNEQAENTQRYWFGKKAGVKQWGRESEREEEIRGTQAQRLVALCGRMENLKVSLDVFVKGHFCDLWSRRSFSQQTPFALKPLKHWVIAPLVMKHKTMASWLKRRCCYSDEWARAAENPLDGEKVNNVLSRHKLLLLPLLLSAHAKTSRHKLLVCLCVAGWWCRRSERLLFQVSVLKITSLIW